MFATLCFGTLLSVLEDSCLLRTDGSRGRFLEIRPDRSKEMKNQGNSWGGGDLKAMAQREWRRWAL